MAAIANNPKFAKKVGVPKATGEEFMKADKGRKFKEGGAMDMAKDKKLVKKAVGMHEKQLHGGKKSNLTKLRSGGSCKGYRAGGKVRYNDGGMPDYEREPSAEDRKIQEGAMAEYTDRKEKEAIMSKPLAKASFKEAFADARASGDKTFEYMGKKYSTEMAKPKAPVKRRPLPGKAAEGQMSNVIGAKKGGMIKRGCGIATKGLTKGKMV
jgi:hypothetical protein